MLLAFNIPGRLLEYGVLSSEPRVQSPAQLIRISVLEIGTGLSSGIWALLELVVSIKLLPKIFIVWILLLLMIFIIAIIPTEDTKRKIKIMKSIAIKDGMLFLFFFKLN